MRQSVAIPVYILLLLALLSCQKQQSSCILPASVILKPGDVVFRRGGGLASRVVVAADRQGNYSHTGIVVDSCGLMMIVHAVPDEHDDGSDSDRIKMDTPERFFAKDRATVGEVCRYSDSLLALRASQIAAQMYRRGTAFDHDYDDSDTTRMYCTELLEYAFARAGHSIAGGRRHTVSLPFLHTRCILPSDIYCSPQLKSIYAFP